MRFASTEAESATAKSRSLLACTRARLNLWSGPPTATKLSPGGVGASGAFFVSLRFCS